MDDPTIRSRYEVQIGYGKDETGYPVCFSHAHDGEEKKKCKSFTMHISEPNSGEEYDME